MDLEAQRAINNAAANAKARAKEGVKEQSPIENAKELGQKMVTNPAYLPVLLMMAISISVAGILLFYEADHFFLKFGTVIIVVAIGLLGQVQGTFLVYTSVQLQEQIDEFAINNERMHQENLKFQKENKDFAEGNSKMKEQCEALEGTVAKMKAAADTLQEQLDGLRTLQEVMSKNSSINDADFLKTMDNAKTMLEKLDAMTKENTKTLLFKVAQDLEFADDEEGLNKNEYAAFLLRIPNVVQKSFPPFESIAEGSPLVVSFDRISSAIERALA